MLCFGGCPLIVKIWRLTVVFCLAKCLLSPDCPAYLGKELFIFHDAVSDHQAVFMFFQLIYFVFIVICRLPVVPHCILISYKTYISSSHGHKLPIQTK